MEDSELACPYGHGDRDIYYDPEGWMEGRWFAYDGWDHPAGRIIIFPVSVWISWGWRYQAVCRVRRFCRNGSLAYCPVFFHIWWNHFFSVHGEKCMDSVDKKAKAETQRKK